MFAALGTIIGWIAAIARIAGSFWGWVTAFSALLVRFFIAIKNWFLKLLGYGGGAAAGGGLGAVLSSGGIVGFFIAIQGISWLLSIIIGIALAFFGSDIISFLIDLTPLRGLIDDMLSTLESFPSGFDALGFQNAFGTTFSDIVTYFNFFTILNLFITVIFGIFALKLNIIVWKAYLRRRNIGRYVYGGPNYGSPL